MANTPTNDMISDDYRRQLQEKHATDSEWGNTGIRLYGTLLEMIDRTNAQSVLDYGCGKGLVGTRFREEQKQPGNKYAHVDFREYDPGIPGKDLADTSADVLFNTDVLEHIEPEFLDNVLADMARRTNKAAFMLISCVSAFHRLPDGHDLAELPLEAVAGVPGVVVDAGASADRAAIGPDAFAGLDLQGKAVLVRTGWDRHFGTEAYGDPSHPHLTGAAAEALVAAGPTVVGIDSVNIDGTSGGERPVHTLLLAASIYPLEHLTGLDQLDQPDFEVFAVPPKVRGMGTFPVRAFARWP